MYEYKKNDYLNPVENINIEKKTAVNENEEIHIHGFFEMIYIKSGTCVQHINNKTYNVKHGDLLFVNYNQTHAFEVNESMVYYNILLTPAFFNDELLYSENIFDILTMSLYREFNSDFSSDAPLACFRGSEMIEIENIISNMYSEFNEKYCGYRAVLNGYMRVLFSKMLRKMQFMNSNENFYSTNLIDDMINYINNNCFDKIQLKDIAAKCFYNPSYLSRAFKNYCGKSITAYIKEKRIEEASQLLKTTELTIDEIRKNVGYSDKKLFYKHFKDVFYVTPREYRKSKK